MEVGKSSGRIFSFKCLLLYSKQPASVYKGNALERCRETYNASSPPWAEDDAGLKGGILYIDDIVIVDNDGQHGPIVKSARQLWRRACIHSVLILLKQVAALH